MPHYAFRARVALRSGQIDSAGTLAWLAWQRDFASCLDRCSLAGLCKSEEVSEWKFLHADAGRDARAAGGVPGRVAARTCSRSTTWCSRSSTARRSRCRALGKLFYTSAHRITGKKTNPHLVRDMVVTHLR